MASKDSAGVAECPVCFNIYTDPRILPVCGHSFCLKCIKQSAKSNDQGVECPLCRKLFSVTGEGFEGLPVNYALISIIENVCFDNYRKAHIKDDEELDDIPSNWCTIHQHEEFLLVCDDCWTPVCVKCQKEAHSDHNMLSERKFLTKAVKLLQIDAKEKSVILVEIENQRGKLRDNKDKLLKQVTAQELAINKEYESVKLYLEQERTNLIEELHSNKQLVLKNIEHCDKELEAQEQCFESLNVLIEKMAKEDRSRANFEKVHQLREVKERLNHVTNEKLELGQTEQGFKFLPADIKSLVMNVSSTKEANIIGKLQLNSVHYDSSDLSGQAPPPGLDKPQKRNRHLLRDVWAGSNNTENVNSEVISSLSQNFPVDDHLWHYILFKHADEVGNITSRNLCEARVVPNSSGQRVSYSLQVSSFANEFSKEVDAKNSVENAIEEFAQLFQKLSVRPIIEENVTLPTELNRTDADNLKKTLEGMGFLLMSSGIHRLIGPLDCFEQAKKKVREVIDGLQKRTQPVSVPKKKRDKNELPSEHKDKAGQPLTFRSPNGLTVFVSQGDIVKQRVDAIVNPTNSDLSHVGGTARAISDAAGHELNKECQHHIYYKGPLKTTWVMHTSAGRLQPNIRYVVHAVGPRKTNSTTDEVMFEGVKRTIYNCLYYANTRLKINSIAIPAISSGIFRVPLNIVAEASFTALKEFDNTYTSSNGTKYLNEVHFLNMDTPTVSGMRTAFAALLKNSVGASLDSDESTNQREVVVNYAAAFGRTISSAKSDKDCFVKAITTALQKEFIFSLNFRDVEDMIKRELKENASYYKDYQLTPDESWTDKLRNIFSSPSLDSELNTDLLLSVAASAFKVEIVLVEVPTSREPFERNFKPRFSSMKYTDRSIYISCYFAGGHSHFDALVKSSLISQLPVGL